jgi:DNA repair protein SbcD/Mre11
MKLLHTSDWHLGKALFGEKRYDEHEKFLDWLIGVIAAENIDLLIVSGDVFDTTTPSNRATELYYSFLCKTKSTSCKNVIITGGNHDSPSFLAAPGNLLKHLNIFVVSEAGNPEDEIIEIKDEKGDTRMIVCAVPYLKDRNVRISSPGETAADKERNLLAGIRKHYESVHSLGKELKDKLKVPLVSTGHLFTSGGTINQGDGVRELYIGTLARVEGSIFPEFIDYAALGHLHSAQSVAGRENIRYSGSPIPMGFGEASQEKKVVVAEISQSERNIKEVTVPPFIKLVSIKGAREKIFEKLEELKKEGSQYWIELTGEGFETGAAINELASEIEQHKSFKVLKKINPDQKTPVLSPTEETSALEELEPDAVFDLLMEKKNVSQEKRDELKEAYNILIGEMSNDDPNKE